MATSIYFERAPVVERVLGVQFQPISGIHGGLLGAFWKSLGSEWSNASDAAPIPLQFERFGSAAPLSLPSFPGFYPGAPASRLQILNRAGDRMVQLQNGRFHFNWKGQAGDDYPRYAQLRQEFEDLWRRFADFLPEQTRHALSMNQWEIAYVNQFPKGKGWESASDWHKLFQSFVKLPAEGATLNLESVGAAWNYEILPRRGRLYVELRHGHKEFRATDELLMLNLTARGTIDGERDPETELRSGLDLGHDTIVQTFKDFTSNAAHAEWKLQNGIA